MKSSMNNNNNSHAANNSFSSQVTDSKSIYTVEINTQTEDEKITLITKEVTSDDASAMLRSSISSNNNKLPSSLGTPVSVLASNSKATTKHSTTTDHNSSAYTISSTDELSFEESILDESPLSLLEKNSKQRQQLLRGETYRGSGKGLPLEVQRQRLLAATSQGATYGAKSVRKESAGNKSVESKSSSTKGGSDNKSISGKSYKSHIKQKQRHANVPTTIEELSIDSYSIGQAEEEEKWTKSDDKWLESESSDDKWLEESDDGFSVSVDEEISILSQMEQRRPTTSHDKLNSKSENMNSKSEKKKKSWLSSWGSSERKKKDTYSMESSSISSSRGGGTTISSSKQSMASRSSASRSNTSRSNTSRSSRSYHSGPSTLSPQSSEEASHHHLQSIQEDDDENELPPSSSVSSQYQTNISNLVSSSMVGSSSSTTQNDINESISKAKKEGGIFSKLLGGESSNAVATRLGYHPPSSLEKQRVDTLLNNEFPQENNLHNISTPGGERSNSSSTTSSCVKRARELLVDIESRGPSQYDDDDSSYNNNHNGRKRRLCNSKVLTKKGCILSATLLLLIFGIVGTLTSLNVIMLPSSLDWRAFSLGNNNNSSTLNEDTNNEGGGEVVSTEVWYVNWDIYKCVKDCIGPLPCGGERTNHLEVDFASLESCCKHGFEVYISNDWSVEECIEVSSYGIEPNNDEDGDEDTEYPTFSPVLQGEVKTRRPNKQPTVVQGSRAPPSSPNDGQFNVPATEENKEMYYANWDTNKCTLQSSLTKKPWDIGYETEEECCIPNFGWISDSDCYTDGSSGIVAPSPSALDNTTGDKSDSLVYYADFVQGKCLPKSSSATHSRFQHTFATYDKCCHDNFRWNVDSDCYTDTSHTTVDVTTVIDKRDDTLPPAVAPPQDTEEDDTSEESTAVDLSDIIGTASPSVTPTSSNQKYYADFTTRTCILKHVSTMARWDTGYESHDTCCMKNFSYDPNNVCYVGEQNAVTSQTPATSAASEETEEESSVEMLYFAHFDQGKCIEDTAEQGAKWGLGYSTQNECCQAYFKYSRESSCYDGSAGTLSLNQTDNGDRIIDNGEVTLAPIDSPTYLPTSDFPTLGKCMLVPCSLFTFIFIDSLDYT